MTAFLTATADPFCSIPDFAGVTAATAIATLEPDTAPADDRWSDLVILVRQAQSGDRAAFGQLVEQFERTVHAICLRRLGNPSEALELTQEVFLHVMDRLDQLREPERFAGWLRQVTARMAINRATRRVPLPNVDSEILEAAGETRQDPLDELIARERATQLWAALERLKTLDRETLVNFYIHGQSLVEMAERTGAPIGTLKRRLHTARNRLKAELRSSAVDADEWDDEASAADEAEAAEALAYA